MFGGDKKKELEKEIKDERIDLAQFIKENSNDAKKKLDEVLSPDKMEFCSRCGKNVGSRVEWGGKCIHDGCTHLLCLECWESGKKRCKEHVKEKLVPIKEEEKKQEKPKEKKKGEKKSEPEKRKEDADKEEDAPIKAPFEDKSTDDNTETKKSIKGIVKTILPEKPRIDMAVRITNDENIIRGYASDYREFVHDRLVIYGTPDFSPKGYFNKGGYKWEDDNNFLVYRRWIIFRRPMLRIHVVPFVRYEPPLENYIAGIVNGAKRGAYNIFIFVTDNGRVNKDVEDLVNRFESARASVFFYDARKKKLHRSNDGLDMFFSSWLDPNQRPMYFSDLVKIPAEMTGNIAIVSINGFARYLDIDEKKSEKILAKCNVAKRIKGSNSFMVKF